jgi:hypothetical protein
MRLFYLFLILCLVLTLDGCRGTKTITERVEVPVVVTQEHHTESVKIDHVRDSLIQRDSVYYYVKGDTVRIEKWHYLQGTTNVVRVDTLIKVDSVQVPVEVVRQTTEIKEVNVLKWWQKGLMWAGGIGIILLVFFITVKIRTKV